MYLSRLRLNSRHRRAARDLTNPYGVHQTLRWAFPGAGVPGVPLPEGERLLWRDDGVQGLLVQSVMRPQWSVLLEHWPGYLNEPAEILRLNMDDVREGDALRFRLRANVVINRYSDAQPKGPETRSKRQAVREPAAQLAWLRRQGQQGGFELLAAELVQSGTVHLDKGTAPHPMTLYGVTFEGHLRVQDVTALHDTVRQGLGKGKAVGFGLLSLARG
ncbi:type I-E CRISPR-associated protein Cas6/Cse3/CasE (plasmid) [Deinococcus sp. KNUC1210]|uniref:type I-E CRISPR-associated protein Cas6/Cse3/CasE n=1 Tax=Deinococcus sp. KNUC1210 TaxID=2917691 RepID=UPI001EF12F86|nr:type I-E CRISPR-associated protein Cas6/Cse3/CasE [Deinococcus sp. KNUC1210]ULH13949.1 type I-E CRISPR-associated protein Cas6/Cse3/CasE [Deinococcus sp. KNUC1210]